MPKIYVRPAQTLEEAASQMDEAIAYGINHYTNIYDAVLARWSELCKSVSVDALLDIADEFDHIGDIAGEHELYAMRFDFGGYAQKIRDAVGAENAQM